MSQRTARIYTIVILIVSVAVSAGAVVLSLVAREPLPLLLGLLAWILAPFAVGALLLWFFKNPVAAAGWVTLPFLFDLYLTVAAITKTILTDALAWGFSPVWNFILLGPIGAFVARAFRDRRDS